MAFALKEYQTQALAALGGFLSRARGAGDARAMQDAFDDARREALGDVAPLPYRPFTADAPTVPVACLRIPTGGGKTLMAAHAIDVAAKAHVGQPNPVVLWLVPTDAIRVQTLDALRAPGHPYREALRAHWPDDRLAVLDIGEAVQLSPADFGGRCIVLVGTIQALRVEKTQGRQAYAYNEAFEPHFAGVPDTDVFERVGEADLVAQPYLGRGDLGRIKRSLANLLAWHRPVVIVDEAHGAKSPLSFDTLARVRPACVIEWTATPDPSKQNVLYHVSADVLKGEDMIKLPIILAPHPHWSEAVRDAVLTRERLAEAARAEPDYVRPIVLFQAEPKNGEVTADRLRAHLVETLHVAPSRIAVATGAERGLDGVDLMRADCPIDFVITVEALKEGWDCPFAYVFCSLQAIRSPKDMEQLLGRVLRMPYAKRRVAELLNRAYAHLCAPASLEVVREISDRLVSMGFEKMEAERYVQPSLDGDLFDAARRARPLAETSVRVPAVVAQAVARALGDAARVGAVEAAPAGDAFAGGGASIPADAPAVAGGEAGAGGEAPVIGASLAGAACEGASASDPSGAAGEGAAAADGASAVPAGADGDAASGEMRLTLSGVLSPEAIDAAVAAVPRAQQKALRETLEDHQQRALIASAPSERGDRFAPLPQLHLPVQGGLLLFEPELLSDLADYSLAHAPADLPDFRPDDGVRPFLVDVERGRLRVREDEAQYALDLDAPTDAIRREDLLRMLDRRLRRSDVLQPDLIAWLGRAIDGLGAQGHAPAALARHFNALVDACETRLDALLAERRRGAFQRALLPGAIAKPVIDPAQRFAFDPQRYPMRWPYTGTYVFRRHFYPVPGELKPDLAAEETACAVALDRLPGLRWWVRNLDRQPETSFWLPTSTDRFYPDFVAELDHGRLLVVEYKGAHLYGDDDAREKRDIGQAWAAAAREAGVGAVFLMATDAARAGMSVEEQLRRAAAG